MITLQFVPNKELRSLSPNSRIKKLLNIVREDKIVLMEGRLRPEEEAMLIENTMKSITRSFKGIELCTIYPGEKDYGFLNRFKKGLANLLIGYKQGFTVIGPATIIKEIKKDPDKIQLFTKNGIRRKKTKRRK